MEITKDTEIRKLNPTVILTLSRILNISDSWKKLMRIAPNLDDPAGSYLFTSEHILMIEQDARQFKRDAAEVFLSEWGTIGRKRQTCGTMLELLVKAELFRAADYLATTVLKLETPKRPDAGPAAIVDVSELLKKVVGISTTHHNEEKSFSYNVKASSVNNDNKQSKHVGSDSDLIKFSTSKSENCDKPSIALDQRQKIVNNKPNMPANIPIFIENSDKSVSNTFEHGDMWEGWEEANSDELPLCVRESRYSSKIVPDSFNNKTATDSNVSSESSSVLTSSRVNNKVMSSNTNHNLPLVVLDFSDNISQTNKN